MCQSRSRQWRRCNRRLLASHPLKRLQGVEIYSSFWSVLGSHVPWLDIRAIWYPVTSWVQGSGFRVQGSGYRVQDSDFSVKDSGFMGQSRNLEKMVTLLNNVAVAAWDRKVGRGLKRKPLLSSRQQLERV